MTKFCLNTNRLSLRPICAEDARQIFSYRSNPNVNRYQGWIPTSLLDVDEFIATRVAKGINIRDSWFQLVICRKNSDELIGDIGMHFLKDDDSTVELGITLSNNHQGKGYATEALQSVISYLSHQLIKNHFLASIDPQNESSVKLFERLGFRKEALIEQSLLINGEWVDDLIYSLSTR